MNKNLISYISFVLLLHTNVSFAQSTDYAFEMTIEDSRQLSDVLHQLESTYQLLFAYDNTLVDSIRLSHHHIRENDFNAFLKAILANTNLEFKKKGKEILLREIPHSKSQVISGQILAPDGSALPFATIRLMNSHYGCYADTQGQFTLNTDKSAEGYIEISYVGYSPLIVKLSKSTKIDLEHIVLQPKQEYISGMIIVDQSFDLADDQSGLKKRNSDSTSQFLDIDGDLVRDIKRLPGITAHKDQASGIQIRGGDADESLISLDGITLWTAQHMVGLFSNINSEYIDDYQIYKTVFPSIYGGKTSGVVAFQTDNIIQSNFNTTINIGLLTSDITTTIPITDKLKVLFSARKTTSDFVTDPSYDLLAQKSITPRIKSNLSDEDYAQAFQPDYSFQDYFGKLYWQINRKNQLQFSYFNAVDNYGYRSNNSQTRGRVNGLVSFNIEETIGESGRWKNNGYSLQYLSEWSPQLTFKSLYTESKLSSNTDFINEFSFRSENRDDVMITNNRSLSNTILSRKFQSEIEIIRKRHKKLSLGMEIESLKANSDNLGQDKLLHQTANIFSIFGEYHYNISDRWKLYTGLRLSQYQVNSSLHFSPRLQLSYQLNDEIILSTGYGNYHQFAQLIENEDLSGKSTPYWVLADEENINIAHAHQWSTKIMWSKPKWSATIEGFYKSVSNTAQNLLIEYQLDLNLPNALPQSSKALINGQDKIQGIDIQLNYNGKKFRTSNTYTLSQKVNEISLFHRDLSYPDKEDSRHQWKTIVDYFPSQKIKLFAAYVFASGNPYIDLASITQRGNPIRNSYDYHQFLSSLPNYHRFDLGGGYLFKVKNVNMEVGLNVFNLFNRQNLDYIQYSSRPNSTALRSDIIATEVHQLGQTTNVYLKLKF
ncbi:TonB-dependent receptor [Membranihabitans marinus]|uniref:TonB-dependent receptor n=1 Tax=Membranihabitans marinus TaxID=1227546 RepID=UPI001F36646F|nr:TonB-dependent receptor [Membranihabitans marinus]